MLNPTKVLANNILSKKVTLSYILISYIFLVH